MDSQNNQNQDNNMSQGAPQNQAPQNNSGSNMNMSGQNNNTLMAVLSYIGPLVLIPYLANKDNDFVKFHARQGLVVFGIEVLVWILGSFMWQLYMILNIVNLLTLILSIIGIVNAVQGNKKELPVVGAWAKSFNL